MASFELLTVLGNGSGSIATHHRFSVAAFQSGSVLVLWDYARVQGEARKLVLLEPNQRCEHLFFSKDARSILGFWVCQGGQPMLTVWRVTDGMKAAEHRLSDSVASWPFWADFDEETSYFVFAHGGPALSATVMQWDAKGQKPYYVSHGHAGPADGSLGLGLVGDGRHFVLGGAGAVQFWSFAEQTPQLVLKVDFGKPVRAFQVWEHLVYLLSQRGSLQLMNFEGQRGQRSISPPAGTAFTALAVRSSFICLGSDNGDLFIYLTGSLELWKCIEAPPELSQGSSAGALAHRVEFVALGANEDYACVCFADATHGAVHLPSGRYVALRVGHRAAVRALAMAPRLELPAGLGNRLMDPDRVLLPRTLTFVTVAGEPAFIAWPQRGPPVRASLWKPEAWPPREDEGQPLENWALRQSCAGLGGLEGRQLVMTAAAFYPRACLSHDGQLAGAYQLLAGAEDGSLHLLESDAAHEAPSGEVPAGAAATPGFSWRVARIRPPAAEVSEPAMQASSAFGFPGAASCCHLAFSRCGQFALACCRSGRAELLHFPALSRALVLQGRSAAPAGLVRAKALFVWHPTDAQRKYDQNMYVLSHASGPCEVVLYEIYLLGNSYAKSSLLVYALPTICQAAGGAITDFCAHPSQLYLLVAAALPASETRAAVLVFDLWRGELLNSCALFGSLLVTPLHPLRPSICLDASGAFAICTSSPTMVGSLDQNMLQPATTGSEGLLVGDSLMERSATSATAPPLGATAVEPRASVVCVVDFFTGQQVYQCSMEASCLSLGSLSRDPLQLVVGASDGSVSIWRPPEPVVSRALGLLQECKHELLTQEGRDRDIVDHFSPEDVEEAVALHWATHLKQRISWDAWGQGSKAQFKAAPGSGLQAPGARDGHRHKSRSQELDTGDDVVVQARRTWPPPSGVAPSLAGAQSQPMGAGGPLAEPAADGPFAAEWLATSGAGAAAAGPRLQGGRPSPPPVLGPPPWPAAGVRPLAVGAPVPRAPDAVQQTWRQQPLLPQASHRLPEPAELLGPAPELREEFGTAAEHFHDPLPSAPCHGGDCLSGVPRWLERGRPQLPSEASAQESVVQSVFSEIDHFELANPSATSPDDADDSD